MYKKFNLKEIKVTDHFNLNEVWSSDYKEVSPKVLYNAFNHAKILEIIRKYAGNKSINVSSWIRSQEHNKKVGGATKSKHLEGTATDITHANLSTKKLCEIVLDLINKKIIPDGGLGLYLVRDSTFLHYDSNRKVPARFVDFRSSEEIKQGIDKEDAKAWINEETRNKITPLGFWK